MLSPTEALREEEGVASLAKSERPQPEAGVAANGSCDCIEAVNAKLSQFKAGITCTLFGTPQRALVETYSTVDNRRGIKRAPKVLASFCPFCGVSYTKAEGQS